MKSDEPKVDKLTAVTPVERPKERRKPVGSGDGNTAGADSVEVRVWPARDTVDGLPPSAREKHGETEEPPGRYQLRDVLGEGGMGTVKLYHDALIGRDVALKLMAPRARGRESLQARFVREARIQGQLEHPAVLPVYDVGTTTDGAPYFTMKRLRGSTLGEVLEALRQRDSELAQRFTLRRLLGDFVAACRAVSFAHSRGVLHRDLKPSNIMLGDFGEVYVLDWGIAKVLAEHEELVEPRVEGGETWHEVGGVTPLLVDSAHTKTGTIMGTPGYMAPEQFEGNEPLDARVDVYALGAILFEILTLDPLHGGFDVRAVLDSTTHGPPDLAERLRSSSRAIPPELEPIALNATARDPEARYASVAALVVDLEGYLDGDRDLERRRELADSHANRAREAADRLSFTGDLSPDARRRALREASRALSLDPEHHGALHTMMRLLLSPPLEEPPEVRQALLEADTRHSAEQAGQAVWIFLGWLVLIPIGLALGAQNLVLLSAVGLSVALQAGFAIVLSRNPRNHSPWVMAGAVTNALGLVAASRIVSPVIIIPALTVATTLMYVLSPANHRPRLTIALGVAVILAAYTLEFFEWPTRTVYAGAQLIVSPDATNPNPALAIASLLGVTLSLLVFSSIVLLRMRRRLREASQQLYLQAWQLQQIVPDSAQPLGSSGARQRLDVS